MKVNELNAESFDDFLQTSSQCFIVFGASWCQPCQDLKRVLEPLVQDNSDWALAYVDIENNPELVESFEVKSVPYVLVAREGVVLYAQAGALTAQASRELMDQAQALDMSQVKDDS